MDEIGAGIVGVIALTMAGAARSNADAKATDALSKPHRVEKSRECFVISSKTSEGR